MKKVQCCMIKCKKYSNIMLLNETSDVLTNIIICVRVSGKINYTVYTGILCSILDGVDIFFEVVFNIKSNEQQR